MEPIAQYVLYRGEAKPRPGHAWKLRPERGSTITARRPPLSFAPAAVSGQGKESAMRELTEQRNRFLRVVHEGQFSGGDRYKDHLFDGLYRDADPAPASDERTGLLKPGTISLKNGRGR